VNVCIVSLVLFYRFLVELKSRQLYYSFIVYNPYTIVYNKWSAQKTPNWGRVSVKIFIPVVLVVPSPKTITTGLDVFFVLMIRTSQYNFQSYTTKHDSDNRYLHKFPTKIHMEMCSVYGREVQCVENECRFGVRVSP